jgi:hypothetical protein
MANQATAVLRGLIEVEKILVERGILKAPGPPLKEFTRTQGWR